MPTYKFSCNDCGKNFDKFLVSSDISDVTCSVCGSPEVKRVFSDIISVPAKGAATIPKGALSGGSCKSGFS
jgi:putative FmdB family regulatory protein